jgi:putative ABC transport system permease protein
MASSDRHEPRGSVALFVALFLARRGLRESLLSTGLTIAAVAVGIGFEVPATANLRGYRAELLAQALDSGSGDVRVHPRRGIYIRDADRLAARLARIPGVTEATPAIGAPASVNAHGHAASLGILGVEPRAAYHPYRLISGHPLADQDHDGILLGSSLAQHLGVTVGDQVELRVMLSSYPRLVLDDGGYGIYTMTIRGLVGFSAADSAFVTRSFLAGELGDETAASAVLVHARNHEAAEAIAAAATRIAPDVEPRSWMDDSAYLRSSVRAVETLGRASWLLGILAVGIPVMALLYINTLNRRRQIGLLTAMGFSRPDLFFTFLFQAFFLGASGVALGGLVAVALVGYLEGHPIFDWQGFVVRPILTLSDVARTAGAILLTTLAAGSYPAWRAARVDPSRILRGIE